MKRLRIRKNSWIIIPVLVLSFFSSPAKADTFETNGANDFFFTLESGTTFTIRTFAQSRGIDSMLWLYDSNDQLLVSNDDHFGLDSYISYPVQNSGTYRIRTGVCCGDPTRWYGDSYTFESSSVPTNAPETTTTTSSTTTTTIAPYLNPPINLRVSSINESKVYLDWDLPLESNTQVERYAIFWSCDNWSTSLAISSTATTAVIENLDSGTTCEFRVRADNDSQSIYSAYSEIISGTTNTTTTTSTTTTTTTTTSTTTTSTTTTTVPETTTSVFISPFTTTSTVQIATTTVAPTTSVLQTTTTAVPTTTTPPTTTTTTTTQPPQGIDEEVSQLIENTEDLSKEEIISAIENIIKDGVSSEEAASIATNPDILEAISADEAKEIFQEISVSDLSVEEESALVEALTNAPDDVKNAFEEEIDIFGEGLDDYVPTGSEIDVKARRALIAVTTALTAVTTAPMPSGGSSAPSGGGAGGPSGDGGSSEDRQSRRSRRK